MKGLSVKVRITVWITLMMLLLSGAVLVFLMSISRSVTVQTAMTQLSQAVQSNLAYVDVDDGTLALDDGFQFYRSGVYTLVYSSTETLLAGQVPVSFTASEPFSNGETRIVDVDGDEYIVLDLWVASGWDDGVWLRGIMELPEQVQTSRNILIMTMIALPLFVFLAALGSYIIIRRAFRPLDNITATVSAINDASDLTGRIPTPPNRDEFARLTDTFNGMFARLEDAFESEKQFIADASHELRTPVSIIKGACEYAEKYDDTPEERQESISMIHRQADKMSRLISQLLSMTRLEHGTERLSFERCDLGELVEEVCAEVDCGGARLHVEAEPELTASVDTALLGRLLRNLVENALRYGRPDGDVWVSVSRGRNGEKLLSVRDNGIGIAPEQQEQVWKRFYQVDPSRSDSSGSGLGLAMVRQIAQTLGGYMTLESVPDKGSTFTLHLPEKADENKNKKV
ncbi:MAG: HAMP domain-containing histidine kinase [Oscillospiraceae bacterium]|nr:HAMP domain-containing histidine kinase [Oscillospiraceae bacterium]